jgi:hypothetical protein
MFFKPLHGTHCHLGHHRKKEERNEREPNGVPKTFMPSKKVQKPTRRENQRQVEG